jgi:mannose-6-phosphate isomerase-like protein (cupin superfamily)
MADEKTYARFEMSRVVAEQLVGDRPYLEFLRHDTMSVGLYVLEAGATDVQKPHAEDELYYVIEGRAVLEVDGDQRPVQPGTLVFVPARMQHRFHSVAAKLSVLVFFAPAESVVNAG